VAAWLAALIVGAALLAAASVKADVEEIKERTHHERTGI
jgi:hypothetical protein